MGHLDGLARISLSAARICRSMNNSTLPFPAPSHDETLNSRRSSAVPSLSFFFRIEFFLELLFYDSYLLKHRLHTDIFLICEQFRNEVRIQKSVWNTQGNRARVKNRDPSFLFFFFLLRDQGHFRSLTQPSLVRVTVTVLLYPLFSPRRKRGSAFREPSPQPVITFAFILPSSSRVLSLSLPAALVSI